MLNDGNVAGMESVPFVSVSLLKEVHSWEKNGATFQEVVDRLRTRCVPPGYKPHPWSSGITYPF